MVQRDIILDQIEELGRVLGKVMADFLGLSTVEEVSDGVESTNKQLKNELDIDIEKLLILDENQSQKYLTDRKLTPEHIENLSKYFEKIGLNKLEKNEVDANLYIRKALILLELMLDMSKTISFERFNRKSKMESLLDVEE